MVYEGEVGEITDATREPLVVFGWRRRDVVGVVPERLRGIGVSVIGIVLSREEYGVSLQGVLCEFAGGIKGVVLLSFWENMDCFGEVGH